MVWFMQEREQSLTSFDICINLFFFTSIFLCGCYLNIYVLTPKFLLNNRWGMYFCYLLCIVFIIVATIIISQIIISSNNFSELNYLAFIVNLISSLLSIFLLLVGTSTLVIFKYWILDIQQSDELESSTLQLELKLLENQINPHFLFNMLNNANIMIKKEPDIALHIIEKLEDMLRYQMDGTAHKKVSLKEDILFLNDYLELEKTRRDYFVYNICTEGILDNIQIPPLLFITFVENAVKHNHDSQAISYVNISFRLVEDKLRFICENSIPQQPPTKQTGGIGLINIKRRLNLLYNDNYLLEQIKTDTTYTIKLEIKL